jgi:hypothetical protein
MAFAGVSLCRIIPLISLFGGIQAEEQRATLNTTLTEAVEWLHSVAISELHIAYKFAEIIQGLHSQTLRRERRTQTTTPTPHPHSISTTPNDAPPGWAVQYPQTPNQQQPGQPQVAFAQPYPPTPTYLQSPTGAPFSPFSNQPGVYPQHGFGQQTGYDDSYFVGLFPELMGPGFVEQGFAGGLGQSVGGGGFDDAFGLWGFRNG